jgi:hypothetical protein
MTPGGIDPSVLSVGNQLLQPGLSELGATIATAPDGQQYLIVTLRVTSGELTVWLNRAEATTWRDLLDLKIAKMSSLILPPPGSTGANGGRP